MGPLQELDESEMSEALAGAVEKQLPVTMTVRRGEAWQTLQSRFMAIRDARLLFEPPTPGRGAAACGLSPAEVIGVNFKYRRHKYIFGTTVIGNWQVPAGEGTVAALALGIPTSMQRIQRRACYRAPVPSDHVVRLSFWLGGAASEPTGALSKRPVWAGRVTDISAGGFQAFVSADVADAVEAGESMGLRITFEQSDETIVTGAHLRHIRPAKDGASLGFQFVSLEVTPEGKAALRLISRIVSEIQRDGLVRRSVQEAQSPHAAHL